MGNFLLFYAPFIVVVLCLIVIFWWAPKDHYVTKNEEKSRK